MKKHNLYSKLIFPEVSARCGVVITPALAPALALAQIFTKQYWTIEAYTRCNSRTFREKFGQGQGQGWKILPPHLVCTSLPRSSHNHPRHMIRHVVIGNDLQIDNSNVPTACSRIRGIGRTTLKFC